MPVGRLFLCPWPADAGFTHKIGARPSLFMLFTGLPVRSLSLQPGRLRCALSGYVVESLSMQPFPVAYRLLAMRLQSFAAFGTWTGAPSLLTRIVKEQLSSALISKESFS